MEAMDLFSSCNIEEVALEQCLLFSDSLKDLKKLRSQLYSAADYFEVSYTNGNHKQTLVNTLRDYTIKALISTVDHLGSVTYKVNGLLDEKADEVTGTDLRIACIEQRLRTCQECVDHEGIVQQSLVMTAPRFHNRYILPGKHVEETVHCSKQNVSKYRGCCLDNDNWNHSMNAVQTLIRDAQPSTIRKDPSPSPRLSARPASFSFTEKRSKPKVTEKRSMSPLRTVLPLLRPGSLLSRSSTPRSSRPTTPTSSRPIASTSSRAASPASGRPRALTSTRPITPASTRPRASTRPTTPVRRPMSPPRAFTQTGPTPSSFNRRQQHLETRKSSGTQVRPECNYQSDNEQYTTKTKRLFKALLSRHKAKHDDTLYTYLDEY